MASDALAARLAELGKLSKIARAEIASLAEQMGRADTERTDSDKLVIQVGKEPKQHTVRLNFCACRS